MSVRKWIIEKGVYPYMEIRRGNLIRKKTSELRQNQNAGLTELTRLQGEKLRRLLIHCINTVPAYENCKYLEKEIMADALAALPKFPVLDKGTFKKEFESYISQDADRSSLIENQTGGSTSEPVKFFMDRHMVEYYEAARWRGLSWWSITHGSPSVMIWGNPQDLGSFENKRYHLKERWLKNRIMIPAYAIKADKMQNYLNAIRKFKPEYIYGYSSALELFANLLVDKKLSVGLNLKAVVSTAETLHDYQRETIEEAFGCPVVNEYGARDAGIIAYQCPAGSMHISAENAILEVVDPESLEPLPMGERGVFLVTDLNNTVMPRLRYRLGDRGTLSEEKCSCGMGLPILKELDGREADIFITVDGKFIHGHAFNRLSRSINSVKQFQIIQEQPSLARLAIVRSEGYDQGEIDWFISSVKQMLPGTKIDISMVNHIPVSGSGKLCNTIRKF
ncbi:MAG TPA: hypothetical protein VFC96_03080 [Anaerovoracaceae bacterium]|nr:hypothetical protein [Anaerovoracaceae bacterium]